MASHLGAGLAQGAPAVNDSFSSPTVITAYPAVITSTLAEATLEPNEPVPHVFATPSIWYRWTSNFTGPVQIDTYGSQYQTLLLVGVGNDLATLNVLKTDDLSQIFEGKFQSRILLDAVAGVTYHIGVYGYGGGGKETSFSISVRTSIPGSKAGLRVRMAPLRWRTLRFP